MVMVPNTINKAFVIHDYRVAFAARTLIEVVITDNLAMDADSFYGCIFTTLSN